MGRLFDMSCVIFLNKGWISENFNLVGNVPVETILLQI